MNTKQFRIYRPNRTHTGFASSLQLSYKPKEKFEKWMVFWTMCKQTGSDSDGNATFDWNDTNLTVKLNETDIGELLSVLRGLKNETQLYHQTKDGESKILKLSKNDKGDGFYIGVSAKSKDKEAVRYSHPVSTGEGVVLVVLLENCISAIYGPTQ